MTRVIHVSLDRIEPNPWQTRPVDSEAAIELAKDIRANGLIHPPVGRFLLNGKSIDPAMYGGPASTLLDEPAAVVQLAVGHHRFMAYELLDEHGTDENEIAWSRIPIQIIEATDEQMAIMAWSENVRRKNMTAVDEARTIRKAMDDFEWKQGDAAEHFQLDRSTVAHKLRLLELPEEVQEANAAGKLSERQALSLSALGRLKDMEYKKDICWSEEVDSNNNFYGTNAVAKPEEYIDYVINHAEEVSSDDIREYSISTLNHAGEKIPGDIPKMKLESDETVQAVCKECQYQVNGYCLHAPCLGEKFWLYGKRVAGWAALELGLPHSFDEEHFLPWANYEAAEKLKDAWLAGTCVHLVVGWSPDGYGARPFTDKHWMYSEGDAFYSSKDGVILGCTHENIGECAAPEEALEEYVPNPIRERADGWIDAAKNQRRELEKRTKQALYGELAHWVTGKIPFEVLLKLIEGDKERDYSVEVEKLAAALVNYAWQRGSFFDYEHESAFKFYPRAVEILYAAGKLRPEFVLDEGFNDEQRLIRKAQRVLGWWAEARRVHYQKEKKAEEIMMAVTALRVTIGEIGWRPGPELEQIDEDLSLVEDELEAILRDEETKEETLRKESTKEEEVVLTT